MEKFKKIDKEFLLSDSTLNCYSFRLLTAGYQLDEYKKNPIGYRMHNREDGVVLRWEDLRVDGDKVYAKPVINLSNAKGQQTVDEVENGFLNAASVGHLVALEISKDPKDYLPNQKGPTVTKWYNRECSLVDIPGNYNALTDLVDAQDNPINLADFNIQKINMEKITLTAAQLALIPNLKAEATQAEVDTAITDLVAKAALADTYKTDKEAAEQKLADAEKKVKTDKVTDLLATAKNDKKISEAVATQLKADYAENPDGLKVILDGLVAYKPVKDQLKENGSERLQALVAKSYAELDKAGELPELQALDMEAFKTKFKEEFKTEYKG